LTIKHGAEQLVTGFMFAYGVMSHDEMQCIPGRFWSRQASKSITSPSARPQLERYRLISSVRIGVMENNRSLQLWNPELDC
jgi:hypothetical protein